MVAAFSVMAGQSAKRRFERPKDVDARHKAGHDGV
jgi:hypothetical protein